MPQESGPCLWAQQQPMKDKINFMRHKYSCSFGSRIISNDEFRSPAQAAVVPYMTFDIQYFSRLLSEHRENAYSIIFQTDAASPAGPVDPSLD